MIVVDASVVVKLFREEPGSELAEQLYSDNHGDLCGPDLLAVEVAAALVRNANMVKAARAAMDCALGELDLMLRDAALVLHRTSATQLAEAARLALGLGHPLKDCLYVALAMELGCPLVTADARFMAKAHEVYGDVRMLDE